MSQKPARGWMVLGAGALACTLAITACGAKPPSTESSTASTDYTVLTPKPTSDGGAVTSSRTISGANVGWGGYITAAAGDRAFYFGKYPCITGAGIPDTTFYRITITNAGKISRFAPVGRHASSLDTTSGCARRFMLSYLDFICFTLVDGRSPRARRARKRQRQRYQRHRPI